MIRIIKAAHIKAPIGNAAQSNTEPSLQDAGMVVQMGGGIPGPGCRNGMASRITASSPEHGAFSQGFLYLLHRLIYGLRIQIGQFIVSL